MTIYEQKGYTDREHYLRSLALEYEIDHESVLNLAHLLGQNEDFDGLIEELKDFSQFL